MRNGLNRRTSMFGCASSASSTLSWPCPDVQIVEQDAHAHAAIGRGDDALRHQPAGRVVVEDVVLEIERVLGMIDQHDAAHQRVRVADQRTEAGLFAVRARFPTHVARRRRVRDRRQRRRGSRGRSVRSVAQPLASAPKQRQARRGANKRFCDASRQASAALFAVCMLNGSVAGAAMPLPSARCGALASASASRVSIRAVEAPAAEAERRRDRGRHRERQRAAGNERRDRARKRRADDEADERLHRGHRAAMMREAIEQQQRQRREVDADADRVQADRQHRPRHARSTAAAARSQDSTPTRQA